MSGFRYWRIELDSWNGGGRGSYITLNSAWFYIGTTKYPDSNLDSATSPAPYVVTSSHEDPGNYIAGWNLFSGYPDSSTVGQWQPAVGTVVQWVQVDMGVDRDFDSLKMKVAGNNGYYISAFRVLGSATGAFTGEETAVYVVTNDGSAEGVWGDGIAPVTFQLKPVAGTGDGAATLPALTATSLGHGFSGVAVSVPVPVPAVYSGAVAASPLPALAAKAFSGANASVQLPVLAPYAAVTAGQPMGVNVSLPSLQASSQSGANAVLALPSLAALSTATFYGWVQTSVALPAPKANASGTPGLVGGSSVGLPMLSASAQSGANASASLPSLNSQSGSTGGVVASVAVVLPSLKAGLAGSPQGKVGLAVVLPMLRATNSGVVRVTLPVLQALASGHVAVTYTFEAYAVNLSHKPKINEASTDEVTRYTNYPFEKIVRYQNNYYGVTPTGLFLLGGATDDGADISWAWKTAEDDFNSPQKKTVISAYFGGRLGPAATVNLHVGEKGAQTYSYASPRGPDVQNFRQVFGRGIKARYYALSASGTGVFELDTIDLDIATLTRRI